MSTLGAQGEGDSAGRRTRWWRAHIKSKSQSGEEMILRCGVRSQRQCIITTPDLFIEHQESHSRFIGIDSVNNCFLIKNVLRPWGFNRLRARAQRGHYISRNPFWSCLIRHPSYRLCEFWTPPGRGSYRFHSAGLSIGSSHPFSVRTWKRGTFFLHPYSLGSGSVSCSVVSNSLQPHGL